MVSYLSSKQNMWVRFPLSVSEYNNTCSLCGIGKHNSLKICTLKRVIGSSPIASKYYVKKTYDI